MSQDDDEEILKLADEATSDLFKYTTKKPERQEITIQLLIKRNLISKHANPNLQLSSRRVEETDVKALKAAKAEEQAEKLLKLTHIHLDRENIVEIDNLAECLGPITNLYLQHNLIRKIENLEFLTNLKFLVLSNNKIERIENLRALKQLKFLDLSNNRIDDFDVDELPNALVILDLRGNNCAETRTWNENAYKTRLKIYLRNLEQLNGEQLSKREDLEQNDVDDDDDDDDLEARIKHDINKMHKIGEDIIERSKLRQREYEIKSKKDFELVKLQLEKSKRDLIQRLNQNN